MTDPRDRYVNLPAHFRGATVLAAIGLTWALAAVLLPRGLPAGIVLLGATFGGLYGLVAVGLVLVYRANRVVNFAQAELGALAGVVTVHLAVQRGWSYVAAVPVGLVLGAASGALLEVAVMRRFRAAPRLIATVATIGLAQVLNGASIILALAFASGATAGEFKTPFSFAFRVDPVVFRGDHLMVLAVGGLAFAMLGVLLRRTGYGTAIRAAADNTDRASLLGLPVPRLSTLVWTAAGLLSAIGIVLRVPLTGFISFTAISGGGTSLLLRAMAAAVIARMDRFGIAVIAGVALGVVEFAAAWSWGNTAYADGILVVVILGALLLQRTDFSRLAEGLQATSAYQAIREVRPVPAELQAVPEVKWGTLVVRVGLVALAVLFPLWASPSRIQLLSLVLIYSLVAVSLVVLTGWAGHISLGHWALVGLSGTTMTVLFGRHGLDLLPATAAAVAAGALIAVAIGVPALRVRGPFLAVTTLAFAVTASTLLLNVRYVPWLVGDQIQRPALLGRFPLSEEWQLYYFILVVLVLVVAAVQALRRSRTGRALIALRDNRLHAAAVGISSVRLQLVAFALSGGLAGLAGVLYALHQSGIRQDAFAPVVGLRIFSVAVIGGLGSIGGAVAGAIFIRGAEFFLSPGWALLFSGAGILVLLLVVPGGVGEILYRARDRLLRAVADHRRIVVPSLVADTAQPTESPEEPTARPLVSGKRRVGQRVLLAVRGLNAAYDDVQVLFGVDVDVLEGEIVALLGTNGAGKSTVLRAVSGLMQPLSGSVTFADRDVTGASTTRVVDEGVMMVPGARAVFPSLTVAEHFRVAGWSQRHDQEHLCSATDKALATFPFLRDRWNTPAGSLSGGQQQMLNLSMALLAKPKLLMIDELTTGLAPIVVDQLIDVVRSIHAGGTTLVIVEQSVNTALRLASRAVFMEKGEVRFTGPTQSLLERADLLRAVFITGAASSNGGRRRRPAARPREPTDGSGSSAVLETRDLSKRYGGISAVNEVTVSLFDGELLGLIGPNGAGKTTLFDLVSGFVAPDHGTVQLHGRDVTRWPAHTRATAGLGRVFQDARLWPSLTVGEAIAVARERHVAVRNPVAALMGLPVVAESESKVTLATDELIELLGLGAFRDKFVSELSTGSRRVVEIATLLAHRPDVLLLDEPSSGIAQREVEALVPMLRDVRRELDCSIVVIDHDMNLVLALVDRLIALDQGAVVATGAPSVVVRDPLVMASFLGVPDVPAGATR